MKGIFKDSDTVTRTLQFILISAIFFIISLIAAGLCALGNFSEIAYLRTAQLAYTIFAYTIPPFVLAWMWSRRPLNFLKLNQKPNWKSALLVTLFLIIAIPFINLLADLNQRIVLPEFLSEFESKMRAMEEQATLQTEKLLNTSSISSLLFNLFLMAIIPALGEEVFFRGTAQQLFQEWRGKIFAIWLAAFFFSAVHLQFYGFIPRVLLGAFFGYLLVWSNTLWIPILAHFINNAIVVMFYYLENNGYNVIDIDTLGAGSTWWIGALCGVLCIAGLFLLKKVLVKNASTSQSLQSKNGSI